MSRGPAIVHLIGFPGAGKYTIARTLAERRSDDHDRFVVVDNHHINNTVFAVMDVDGVKVLPQQVWDRVGEVREAVLRTIEQLAPPQWSYVFTNVLVEGNEADALGVERLIVLAERRKCPYLLVRLLCEPTELLDRVGHEGRRGRMKWIDRAGVGEFVATNEVLKPDQVPSFDLDVTRLSPEQAADAILNQLDRLV